MALNQGWRTGAADADVEIIARAGRRATPARRAVERMLAL